MRCGLALRCSGSSEKASVTARATAQHTRDVCCAARSSFCCGSVGCKQLAERPPHARRGTSPQNALSRLVRLHVPQSGSEPQAAEPGARLPAMAAADPFAVCFRCTHSNVLPAAHQPIGGTPSCAISVLHIGRGDALVAFCVVHGTAAVTPQPCLHGAPERTARAKRTSVVI